MENHGTRRVALLVCAMLALAAASAPDDRALPRLTGPVNDLAHVIDPDSLHSLNTQLSALRKATSDAIVVATVETIAPFPTIDEYAVKLFAQNGVGDKKDDNGLLVVLAVRERRVRIEVGYGLESIITDGFSGQTIRDEMAPAFRDGRFGPGLVAGVTTIAARIAKARGVTLDDTPAEPAEADSMSRGEMIGGIVLLVVLAGLALGVILLVIWFIARLTGGARATPAPDGVLGSGGGGSTSSSGDDDSSGDSSSFGGGSSGGGGASGSW